MAIQILSRRRQRGRCPADRRPEAERLHQQALSIYDDLLQRDPRNRDWLDARASCLVQLGRLAQFADDADGARTRFENALETSARAGADQPVALESSNARAACHAYRADLDERADDLRGAIRNRLESSRWLQHSVKLAPNPPDSEWCSNLRKGYDKLAALHHRLGEPEAAAEFERKAHELRSATSSPTTD